jgi:reverse gyrase
VSLSAQAAVATAASHGKTLMVVESPTKAVKIQKFLGDDYKVMTAAAVKQQEHEHAAELYHALFAV